MSERSEPLGFWSLLALGINGIVGVGIFFAPSEVGALVPGNAGILVYLVTALALAPVAVVYARLGGRYAEDGGPYVWARAAYGPLAGFGVGWIAWVSALFSTSAVVSGLAEHAGPALGFTDPHSHRLLAVVCVAVLAATAATGLRPSAWVWNSVTVLKLIPLAALVIAFVIAGAPLATGSAPTPSAGSFGRAVLVVVFATQGFEIVPVPAGNARRSARAVPFATVLSLAGAGLLYVLLHAACVSLPDLAHTPAPLVAAAGHHGGTRLGQLVAVGTNVSALGIAFGMFAMTPRYLAALGRGDGLGSWLAEESRARVPLASLLVTAAGVAVLVMAGELRELFALSSVAVLAQYTVSAASLVALAVRREKGLRPAQLWPAPLVLIAAGVVARAATKTELAVAGGVLVLGAVLRGVHHFSGRLSG